MRQRDRRQRDKRRRGRSQRDKKQREERSREKRQTEEDLFEEDTDVENIDKELPMHPAVQKGQIGAKFRIKFELLDRGCGKKAVCKDVLPLIGHTSDSFNVEKEAKKYILK